MHTAVSYIFTGLLITVVFFTLGGKMLGAFGDVTGSWSALEARSLQQARTELTGPTGLSVSATSTVQITLANEGEEPLAQFANWEVIFEVQRSPGLGISQLTYSTTTPPAAGRWAVQGIYLETSPLTAEIVDPGILNPGEEMIVVANPSPSVVAITYNRATFTTPNGVSAQVIFKVVP